MTQQYIKRAMLDRGINRTQSGYFPLLSLVERYIDSPHLYRQSQEEVAQEFQITSDALWTRIRTIGRRCEKRDPEGYRDMMEGGPYRMRLLVQALANDARSLEKLSS